MGKKTGIAAGLLIGAWLMHTETTNPGSAAETAGSLRDAAVPIAAQALGAAGDAVTVVRTELGRQNVGGLLSPPTTAGIGQLNPDRPQGIPNEAAKP